MLPLPNCGQSSWGFGCQRLKKFSNLADSKHFNSEILSSGLVTLVPFGQVLFFFPIAALLEAAAVMFNPLEAKLRQQ